MSADPREPRPGGAGPSQAVTRWALALAVLPLALFGGTGCRGHQYVAAGAMTSTSSNPGRTGGALEAAAAYSLPNSDGTSSPLTFGFGARLKVAENVQQLAPLVGVDLQPDIGSVPLVPIVGAGIQPLHLGAADRSFDFGMGSPYGHLGVFVIVHRVAPAESVRFDALGVLLLATAEYDVRFTSPPSEPFFTLSLGLGQLVRVR